MRTVLNYNTDLESKTNGVTQPCVWNDLMSFHNVVNASFDIMHDLYEGICRYDLAEILYNLIHVKKYFTLARLNRRIKYFDYSDRYDVGNRVPTITGSHL